MNRQTRRKILAVVGSSIGGLAGCLGSRDTTENAESGASDAESGWRSTTLTDVTTDTQFSISELERPALVHPFAIWCSICKNQNERIDALQQQADYHVIQMNVGESENREAVAQYASENGYGSHSRFVVVPNSVADGLVDEFGPTAVSPPQSPVIAVCPDGSAHEINKIAAPETIKSAVKTNCE